MKNEKLTQIKKNIKHYAPEIFVGLAATTAITATVYFKYTNRLFLDVPKENLEMLREGGALVYNVKGHKYALRYVPAN